MYIAVNNIPWLVVRVPWYSDYLIRDDGTLTIGITDTNLRTIFINSSLSLPLFRKVLIHEITHVWIYSYNYNLSIEQEEFVCDFVASNSDDIISKADELIYMQ